MKREEVLIDREKMYAISRDSEGRLYIEVVVGGFAMENLVIPLSDQELSDYEKEGKPAMDELAYRICKEPETFRSRTV